jgi:hypothetical protein
VTRDVAGRAGVCLQARTHYELLDPAVLDSLRALWRQVLGEDDLRALDALFARVIWIADGELEALDNAAREYRAIIGPPDPGPARTGPGDAVCGADPAGGELAPAAGADAGDAGSLADALERACCQA